MEKISRRERKKIESRQAILKAAVQEFSKKGFQGTSVADIMNVAELGTGTFYNYFDSKEDVLISLLTAFVNRVEARVEKLKREQQRASDMLSAICLHTAGFLSQNRFVLPLFMSAAAHSGLPEEGVEDLGG